MSSHGCCWQETPESCWLVDLLVQLLAEVELQWEAAHCIGSMSCRIPQLKATKVMQLIFVLPQKKESVVIVCGREVSV